MDYLSRIKNIKYNLQYVKQNLPNDISQMFKTLSMELAEWILQMVGLFICGVNLLG